MACKQLIEVLAGVALVTAGCGSAGNKTVCNPVPSFASPAVQCVAMAEPKPPPPPKPEPKEEPKPEPPPPPEPEPEKPVVVKKEKIELDRTIQFEPNSAKLIDDSKVLLDEVAKALDEHPEIKIVQIEGHTDSRMGTQHNKKLSVQRANSVRSYLIQKGVAKNRLTAKGFGETKPTGDNSTWKGRFQNRRVDLKITKRDDDASGDASDEGSDASDKGNKGKGDKGKGEKSDKGDKEKGDEGGDKDE